MSHFKINHCNEGRDQIPSIKFPVLLYAEMKFEITKAVCNLSGRLDKTWFEGVFIRKTTSLIKILETATWMK